jgi:hypothetical protein
MKKLIFFFAIAGLICFGSGCKKNKTTEMVPVTVPEQKKETIVRFEQALFRLPSENFDSWVQELRKAHPGFFDLFTSQMIRIGTIEDSLFYSELNRFVTDTMIQNVKKLVDVEFSDFDKIEKDITISLENYKKYFPDRKVPEVYTCISGFNQSIVVTQDFIGASLDKYLGPDCPYYEMMGYPNYIRQKLVRQKLPSDLMFALAVTEFPKSDKESNLLSFMIYEGKLLYFIETMLPKTPDSLKIGYSAKQLAWCKKNELQMWTNLIENKRLYSTGRMDIKRLIDDSPYTNGFPLESPGRTGIWIGWQIVREYMKKHPEVTLPQLMALDDSQKILNDSKYFPD